MNIRIILVVLGVVVIAGAFIGYLIYSGFFKWHIYRVIAHDVSVTSDWTEIRVEPDLRVIKRYQAIDFSVPGARLDLDSDQVFLPDGTVINPEVEIADKGGNWHRLEPGSYGVSDFDAETNSFATITIKFSLPNSVLNPSRFVAVKLKSDTPFVCSTIRWHNYDLK